MRLVNACFKLGPVGTRPNTWHDALPGIQLPQRGKVWGPFLDAGSKIALQIGPDKYLGPFLVETMNCYLQQEHCADIIACGDLRVLTSQEARTCEEIADVEHKIHELQVELAKLKAKLK